MASRKQIAAAKRNIKKAHAAIRRKTKRKSSPKRRKSSTRKVIKPRKRPKTMAKRRSPSRSSNILGKIPLINNPTFKKAATGIGIATLGVAVLSLVLPQIANQPLVRPVLALLGGGVPGVVAQFLVQGGGGLRNILGNGATGTNGGGNNAGFA